MIKKLLSFHLLLILFSGCEIINPDEEIPAYIKIDTINLVLTDPATQGTASHKITDAWIYVDEQLIGAFELPAHVPVLQKGEQRIRIGAGIKMNGIAATRIEYPFYDDYIETTELKPAETITISPVVNYNPSVTFAWKENFESGMSFETMDSSHTSMSRVLDAAAAFEGAAYGAILLDASKTRYEGKTVFPVPVKLPSGGDNVFFELNYKNNNPFFITLAAVYNTGTSFIPILQVNPSERWNKIYVNLTPEASSSFGASSHYIVISAQKAQETDNAYIHLDNLKLVY